MMRMGRLGYGSAACVSCQGARMPTVANRSSDRRLHAGAGIVASETAASLGGYLTVWAICAAGGFLAALLLLVVPKVAFADAPPA